MIPKPETQSVCIDHSRHPDDWPGNVARHANPRRQCGYTCPAIPRMGVNDIRLIYKAISSSAGRTRTYNQWINSPLLYQLSYRGRLPIGRGQGTSRLLSTQSLSECRSCEVPWPPP